MTNKKWLAIVGIFLLLITGIRLGWILLFNHTEHADAAGGRLDLRAWSRSGSPSNLYLNGDWSFYPGRLMASDPLGALQNGTGVSRTASVPGNWASVLTPAGDSVFGYGSYRLRILVDPASRDTYRLRMPYEPASTAVYVNGRPLDGTGHPAAGRDAYSPGTAPYSVSFQAEGGIIDLIVEAANYDERLGGGLAEPILFGREGPMNRAYWLSAGMQLTLCLLLLTHALYAFVLFVFWARQRALVYLSLLLASAAASILIDDDRMLLVLFPSITFEAIWKLYYWSYLGGAAFLLLYMRDLLTPSRFSRWVRAYSSLSFAYALVVACLPARMLQSFDWAHTVLIVIPFLVVPTLAVLAIRRGQDDLIYVLLGTVAFMSSVLWGLVKNFWWYEIGYYPFDMAAGLLAFALYWFRRYFRSAAETRMLTEQLRAADKQKDEFLAKTSHELRNPLHGMLNIAQTVLEGRGDDERNRERLALLLSVGKRMAFMLNDLMDLTQLRDHRVRLRLTRMQLQTVAAGALDMLRFMTEGKPVRLVNGIPASLPPIVADENRMIQILFNLLHNAVKFTNEGEIRVEAEVAGDQVLIRVSDTGIGMDEETQKRAFRLYEQGDVEQTDSLAGLGLGLAICKQLTEMHRGTLTVRSAPNEGATFTVALPIVGEADAAESGEPDARRCLGSAEAAVAASAYPAQIANIEELEAFAPTRVEDRPAVLVVDDDPVNLNVLTSILSAERYRIATATGAESALDWLDTERWDLVISDVMMPRISGYELTRTIRTRFSPSGLPVLLLTARSRQEDIAAGFRAGANDYIAKPVDATELRSRVRALTAVARTAREQIRIEAAWLQAQIQPHFLFNTLNSIAALSEIDADRMRGLLSTFGEYLKASFNSRNLERVIPLERELELVRAYLYIERERFEDRIRVAWEIDDEVQVQVPPLSIQPIVENAVRHGVLKRSSGGEIRIRVVQEGSYALVSVRDDGVGMDGEALNELLLGRAEPSRRVGIGLANTDRRLRQLFGEGLRIGSSPGQGTTVSFRVPRPPVGHDRPEGAPIGVFMKQAEVGE